MTRVRRSLAFSVVDKYLTQVLVIGTAAIMARILTPEETGLFLVSQAVILLAENFRDFGVGTFIVQARELSRPVLRSAFTVTMLLSLAMGAAIWASAGAVAGYYGQPALEHLLAVATIGFLIVPFGSPLIALMKRDLAFGSLAAINVAAAVATAVITVGLGVLGFGAVSYVWAYVLSSALLTVLALGLRPEPGIFRPSLAGWRPLMSFGSVAVSITVANMAFDLLPKLALGKLVGFDAVGLFGRATTICQLPDRLLVQALQPVVLPAMAERARNGGDLRAAYLQGHAMMSAFQWPALLVLALLADPAVRLLLGPQWGEVPPLVRVMAVATMALAPAFMTYPVLVSLGRIRDALTATILGLPPSVAILVLAATQGLDVLAASMLVVAPLQMLIALWFVRRAIGLTPRDLVAASWRSLAIAAGAAAGPTAVILRSPLGLRLSWSETAVAVALAAAGWALAVVATRHPLAAEAGGVIRRATGRIRRFGSIPET